MNRKKILIVDDDAVIRRTLKMKLNAAGYDALNAADGSEAVSVTRREKPDLIILDITFPPDVGHGGGVAWDGFMIIDWLRRIEEAQGTPIIIITGSPAENFEERALAKGAIAFFHKPVKDAELLGAIQQAIGASPSPESPGT